jgi:glycerol uptake facilitator-like aquaporin
MKKLIVESFGAFYLTMAVGLSYLMVKNISAAPLAIGLTAMIIFHIGSRISGGHFNPIISIACTIKGTLPLSSLPNYILAHLLGASIAFFPVSFLVPHQSLSVGNTNMPQIFAAEFLFSLLLPISFLFFSKQDDKSTPYSGIVIGAIYAISVLLIGDISKGVINPAIGFALLVFRVIPHSLIPVYLSAHILAALVAGLLFKYMVQEEG